MLKGNPALTEVPLVAGKQLPIIAIPGTLMDGASLTMLAPAFRQSPRIEQLGVEDSFDAEIDRLAALVDTPAIWLGHSLGGIAALHLAAIAPWRCAAIIVIASNLRPDGPRGPALRAAQMASWERGGPAAVVVEELAPIYGLSADSVLIPALIEQAKRVGIERFRRQLRYAATRTGLPVDGPALAMPVLALTGASDVLSAPACGDEIRAVAAHPQSRHVSRAGAGHLLPIQEAAWCADQIQTFLASIQ